MLIDACSSPFTRCSRLQAQATCNLPPTRCLLQAMQHKNKLYLTTSEYFGKGDADQRLPSVYWAVVEPTLPGLCALKRKDWGVVASSEGLSLAFPVIAARKEAPGAALAFNYGGAKTVSNSAYPAFAGAWGYAAWFVPALLSA